MPTIFDLPASNGARLLALSWLDQLSIRADQWHYTATSPQEDNAPNVASLIALREALGRLRSCMRNFREVLGDGVQKGERQRLRRLIGLADTALLERGQIAWLERHVTGLGERDLPTGEWMVAMRRARATRLFRLKARK